MFWGKNAGRFFRPAPALGYGLVASACFAPTPAQDALHFVFFPWVHYCHYGIKIENWGELRLWVIVPIRTVLGTGAVLLGSVVAVASVRNFTVLVLGTWYIFYDVLADFI